MELEALQGALSRIRSLGAELVAVSPQLPEQSRALSRKLGLTFDILSDKDNALAEKLGIAFSLSADLKELYLKFGIDLRKANGNGANMLPMPARYVIDRNSVIRYAECDPDYTQRPEPEHTLSALKSL
jgi:peroxiredoxin